MPTFTVEDLRPDELADLETKRDWVRDHFIEDAQSEYETLAGKLRVIDVILGNDWVKPTEKVKLQSLGVAFGDALRQELGVEWKVIVDEQGRDRGLVLPGTSIRIFPLTTISKRIERGEAVDVWELFSDALRHIARIRENAE